MPSLKDVKMKIIGVGKTKQITKAMNMVASAKLRSSQARIERFRPYAEKYREVIGDLAEKADISAHPLLEKRADKKNCGIVLITSDRGLCGGFNANIILKALQILTEKRNEGKNVAFFCVGRKGRDAVRHLGMEPARSIADRMGSIDFNLAIDVAQDVAARYADGQLDEVYLVYGEFQSMAQQPPRVLTLLPIQPPEADEEKTGPDSEYIYEPGEAALLDDLLPRYANVQVFRALLETSASEHAARMQAMDNATRNCDELIKSLTLLYNKTRQASITNELIDIVGGAEALNG
ncbi:MAG: F0F1 ATP synthase subunit gamma [Desulfovibrio sp.]|nr:F0F1 ATP synthase subunit gamma [Desulfovibrio sp.]